MLTPAQISSAATTIGPPPGSTSGGGDNGWGAYDAAFPSSGENAPQNQTSQDTSSSQPGFLSRVGSDLSSRASNIGNALEAKTSQGTPMSVSPLEEPLDIAGNVAGGVQDILGEGLKSAWNTMPSWMQNGLKGAATQAIGGQGSVDAIKQVIPAVADKWNQFQTAHPDASDALKNIGNIALTAGPEAGTVGEAVDVAKPAAEAGIDTLSGAKDAVVGKIKDVTGLGEPSSPEAALAKSAKVYEPLFGKATKSVEGKMATRGVDFNAATEAAREQLPIARDSAGGADTKEAQAIVNERLGSVSDSVLNPKIAADQTSWHNLDETAAKAKEAIMKGSGTGGYKEQATATIDQIVAAEKRVAGADAEKPMMTTGKTAQELRQSLQHEANYDRTSPQATNDARKALATQLNESLDNHYADSADLKAIRAQQQKYILLQNALEKAHGAKIRGGILGKRLNEMMGFAAGAVHGGPLGGMAGKEIAGHATDYILDPARNTKIASERVARAGIKNGLETAGEIGARKPK